jgi:hypothetical protein
MRMKVSFQLLYIFLPFRVTLAPITIELKHIYVLVACITIINFILLYRKNLREMCLDSSQCQIVNMGDAMHYYSNLNDLIFNNAGHRGGNKVYLGGRPIMKL